MEKVIIYGAGVEGEAAFNILRAFPSLDVIFFIDKDENKQGCKFWGRDIFSPNVMENYEEKNTLIVIAVRDDYIKIKKYLESLGFNNLMGLGSINWNFKREGMVLYNELYHKRCIDLGAFFEQNLLENKLTLPELTFLTGESGVLDYAFLYVLALKYKIKKYLEIGTYVGTSINIMSSIVEKCYGITGEIGGPYSMRKWCMKKNLPDFSNKLVKNKNIHMYYGDSKVFDYEKIKDSIDLFFIDADHSYNGVFCDSTNVFQYRSEDSFVVWHDFEQEYQNNEVIIAVKDALGKDFNNVFATNNNICGIYIPPRFQKDFPLTVKSFDNNKEFYTYTTTLSVNKYEK